MEFPVYLSSEWKNFCSVASDPQAGASIGTPRPILLQGPYSHTSVLSIVSPSTQSQFLLGGYTKCSLFVTYFLLPFYFRFVK